jgi:inosine-uridine nucleoside N-ribohydrolase
MAEKLAQMMRAYGKGDPRLHDVCVIAYLVDPFLVHNCASAYCC